MTEKKERKGGLGRGLSALMADLEPAVSAPTNDPASPAEPPARAADVTVPIERIEPNPDQPRRRFETDDLEELANSIAARGIIQPLIVRPHPTRADHYQIVAGERRWRTFRIVSINWDRPSSAKNSD